MKILFLLLLVLIGSSGSQDNLPKEFKELLVNGKMKLTLPDGFELKKNCNDTLTMSDICFRHSTKKIEIRIDIEMITDSEKSYPVLKLYEEGSYESTALDPEKYKATQAGAASFRIAKAYNIGYKQCWQIFMFKSKTAVANVFIFLDENDMKDNEFISLMTMLKFK